MALRAIISDIHGNLEALTAVLADIRQQGAREIVCLGDIVGYGPDPAECVKIVRENCAWSLCGNHDAALYMSHAVGFNEGAAKAVTWQRERMLPRIYSLPSTVARWRWLETIPAERREGNVMYVHASPRDPLMEYVLEEDFKDIGFGASDKAVDIFKHIDWLCFSGHSHRPGVATHEFKWLKPTDMFEMRHHFIPGKKSLINVGAVGQPRDKNKDSCYALFDGSSVLFRRVPYDVEKTMKKIAAVPQLEKRLGERLAVGM